MPFQTPTFDEIRDRYLLSIRNLLPDANTGPDSDHYVRASAIAAIAEQAHAHIIWAFRQGFADLADADYVERMANLRGITRKPASTASGTVRVAGSATTVIPAGTGLATLAASYVTTEEATIGGGGTVDIPAQATAAGSAANVSSPTPATLSAPPAGAETAQVLNITAGADVEKDDALLERLLFEQREAAQGGNASDYRIWALEVPGVRKAYVFPLRRGLGTVDVVPMPEAGLPGAPLLAAVQAHIDVLKPVGMGAGGFQALAPTPVVVNIVATVTLGAGVTLAEVTPLIEAALQREFDATEPGQTLRKSRLIACFINVPGVLDVNLTTPAGNTAIVVDGTQVQLAQMGSVAIT